MDSNNKIENKLTSIASRIIVADKNEYKEEKELYSELDRHIEKYDDFIKDSNLSSKLKRDAKAAIRSLSEIHLKAESEFYNMTDEGEQHNSLMRN